MQHFKSKIGIELIVIFTFAFGLTTYELISERAWIGFLIVLPVLAFIVHMIRTTFYIISGETLIIKCGFFFKQELAITAIKRVSESSDLISAPALSVDRLEILYHKFDTVLISPKDKTGFIKAIRKINPEIEIKLKPQ